MSYSLMMEGRSIEDLHDYINNYQKYWPDAIEAAVEELKKRGEIFTLEEQAEIDHRIAIRKTAQTDMAINEPAPAAQWEQVPIKEETPELYSQPAIFGFSFFFSVIAGGILMNMNLKKLGKEKEAKLVTLFSVLYIIGGTMIFAFLTTNRIASYLFNIVGAVVLNQYFWKKYIGDTPYQRMPVWKPLLICLGIFIVLALLLIQVGGMPQ